MSTVTTAAQTGNSPAEPVRPALDPERIRADFPALHQTIHGRPLVYLDNAATTQKPRVVLDALRQYYELDNANIHRGIHTLSVRATEAYEHTRTRVQQFLNAPRREEIVFVRGATEAINLVAQTFGRSHCAPGDEILISAMEHHSNIVPWQLLCQQTGAQLRVAPIDDRGGLILEAFDELLGPRTRLVAITHVSNALGTINPVHALVAAAHAHGIPVLIDGAQAAPHLPVDVQDIGCDFYVLSAHKLFGPTGVGVLYGRHALLEDLPPYQAGGEMISSVTFERTTFAPLPHRFEAGTPDIAGVVAFSAALDYLDQLGRGAVAEWERELLAYATAALAAIPQIRLIGTATRKAAVLSFVIDAIHPHDVGTVLDQQGIAIRTGHHCAQPVMARFGVPATCRASLAFYNTRAEVDALVTGVHQVIEMFRP
jgi:cysteine desulfurase / selenocysteine lyase